MVRPYRAKDKDRLLPSHLTAMDAIEQCRTEALGGPLSQGMACGALAYSSHAWKNRHCPTCQHDAATRWLAQQRALLLPVPYVLGTLTLPEALRPVARAHQHCLYTLLLQTSAAALQALTRATRSLGGPIGMLGVLPTWPRDLASHPHGHSRVPGGARSCEGTQWRVPRSAAWLVPVRALSKLFCGTFKAALTPAGLCDSVPPQVWQQAWGTHGQPAGTGTEVLTSCAPALSRMALTNNRLEGLANGHVTCRVTQRSGAGWKRLTRPADAFIHRVLQHVLPKGFPTVRSYGFLRLSRRQVLPQIRTRLAAGVSNTLPASGPPHAPRTPPYAPAEARCCRQCGGTLIGLRRRPPHPKEPP